MKPITLSDLIAYLQNLCRDCDPTIKLRGVCGEPVTINESQLENFIYFNQETFCVEISV